MRAPPACGCAVDIVLPVVEKKDVLWRDALKFCESALEEVGIWFLGPERSRIDQSVEMFAKLQRIPDVFRAMMFLHRGEISLAAGSTESVDLRNHRGVE